MSRTPARGTSRPLCSSPHESHHKLCDGVLHLSVIAGYERPCLMCLGFAGAPPPLHSHLASHTTQLLVSQRTTSAVYLPV